MESKSITPHFDDYDRMNDNAAKKFLLASLTPEMREDVTDDMDEDDTAADVWLLIIESFKSTSIDYYEDLREKLKGMRIKQYPNEDLEGNDQGHAAHHR